MIEIMSDLISRLLSISPASKTLGANSILFQQSDAVHVLYIVRSGAIHLVRHQSDGVAAVLQRAMPGKILAEASVYFDRYHCDAIAVSAATVSVVSVGDVIRLLESDLVFANLWSGYLARELQATRKRAEIMALRTVRARLDAWIAWNDGALPSKGAWRHLADEIGVSAEALYREFARRNVRIDKGTGSFKNSP